MPGFLVPKPGLAITVDRANLDRIMTGVATFDQLEDQGKVRFEGNRKIIHQLRDLMVPFTPDFEILPAKAPKAPSEKPKPFEIPDVTPTELD